MPAKSHEEPPPPWNEFLHELDAHLGVRVKLHCIGGFVVSLFYGLPRPTGDIDYFEAVPSDLKSELQTLAGENTALARKHKVHLQAVPFISLPENYDTRLSEMFSGTYRNLHLYALDPYDLILSKLERNSAKDRDDIAFLTRALGLTREILRERYAKELRPSLANERRHDLTIDLWLDDCFE